MNGAGFRELRHPRAVPREEDRRPALLLGFILDQHGRRLFAAVATRRCFAAPEEIDDEPQAEAPA